MAMDRRMFDSFLYHLKGEEDILTGRHSEWLAGEVITVVTAVSSDSTKVAVDSPGTINAEPVNILGLTTPPGEASFVLYRVLDNPGGKRGDKVTITITIQTSDPNRVDVCKHLVEILG